MRTAVGLLVLVGYPLAEILVAVWVAGMIGWPLTILLLVVGFIVGAVVLRLAGASAARDLRTASQTGQLPPGGMGSHALVFLAGVLIAVPGFLTDLLGVLLLVPPSRAVIVWLLGLVLARRLRTGRLHGYRPPGPPPGYGPGAFGPGGAPGAGGGRVIPGEVVRDDPDEDAGPSSP